MLDHKMPDSLDRSFQRRDKPGCVDVFGGGIYQGNVIARSSSELMRREQFSCGKSKNLEYVAVRHADRIRDERSRTAGVDASTLRQAVGHCPRGRWMDQQRARVAAVRD